MPRAVRRALLALIAAAALLAGVVAAVPGGGGGFLGDAPARASAPVLAPDPAAAAAARTRPYPWAARVATARRWVRSRRGVVGFAAMDPRGRIHGFHAPLRFRSASVVKAMLMVAYLNRRGHRERPLTRGDRALLAPMIRWSDNVTATRIRNIVGNEGLQVVARRAGMRNFQTSPIWGDTRITPADQVRFFHRIDRLVPRRHRAYARRLLNTIVPGQRWGVPRVLPPGWRLFFKGGWRPTVRGRLVNQVALLERGEDRIAIAVLTDGNPSHAYGTETVRGVAARLLRNVNRYRVNEGR